MKQMKRLSCSGCLHRSKGLLILGLLSWLLTEEQPVDLTAGLVLITALFFFSVYRATLKIFPFPDAFPSLTFL